MKKKKLIAKAGYVKGTVATKGDVLRIVNASEIIYIKEQAKYEDETEHATIEIHFKPNNVND